MGREDCGTTEDREDKGDPEQVSLYLG
jgi:hypothetical protein